MSEQSTLVGESGDIRVESAQTSPVVTTLSIEVGPKRVRKAYDRAYKELAKNAQVRGFRRGKVPRSVLEKLYGASLPEDIERTLVAETLGDAIELAEVQPLVQPDIEADPPTADEPFRYRAKIEVKPEIELPDFSKLVGKRPDTTVMPDEVHTELEKLRDRNVPLLEEPEDVLAADGHTVTVDFVGRIDGEVFDGGSAEGVDIEIGSGQMIPGFEEGIVGAKAGDDVQVNVDFPEDYGQETLAGKAAEFAVHVTTLRRKAVPELDDEFAKDVGEFDTLDELRDKLQADLQAGRDREADNTLRQSLLDSLVDATEFEVSRGIVERQLHSQIQSMQRQFQNQVPEEVLEGELRRMAEEGRPAAERRVREAFLLEAVATSQSIEVTDDDVNERLQEMGEARGMELGPMRQVAESQGWVDAIRSELLDQKTLDFLTAQATVEEVEKS